MRNKVEIQLEALKLFNDSFEKFEIHLLQKNRERHADFIREIKIKKIEHS